MGVNLHPQNNCNISRTPAAVIWRAMCRGLNIFSRPSRYWWYTNKINEKSLNSNTAAENGYVFLYTCARQSHNGRPQGKNKTVLYDVNWAPAPGFWWWRRQKARSNSSAQQNERRVKWLVWSILNQLIASREWRTVHRCITAEDFVFCFRMQPAWMH